MEKGENEIMKIIKSLFPVKLVAPGWLRMMLQSLMISHNNAQKHNIEKAEPVYCYIDNRKNSP